MNSKGTGVTASVWWEVQLCEPGGPEAVTAEKIAELKPHAKTIVIGLEVAESTKELSDCFIQEAKKNGLDIINETNNEADNAAGSQKVFEPLLTKYPEVEAVFDYNDESAMGVSAALLAGGKKSPRSKNPKGSSSPVPTATRTRSKRSKKAASPGPGTRTTWPPASPRSNRWTARWKVKNRKA